MQQAYVSARGFVPMDRVLLRQPLAKMIQDMLAPHVDMYTDEKVSIIEYHYRVNDHVMTENEKAIARWRIAAGNEHRMITESLDARRGYIASSLPMTTFDTSSQEKT